LGHEFDFSGSRDVIGHVTMTSRDHLIPHMPFSIGSPLEGSLHLRPFSRYIAQKRIGVTNLTFQGHVTSWVT